MNRRRLVEWVAAMAGLAGLAGAGGLPRAQTNRRIRRVGILGNVAPADDPLHRSFVAAMSELGWHEGKEIAYDYRGAEQRYERLPELARELAALNVDLIVVSAGVTAALAAKQATATIPILAVGVADPVKFGLVASLARPGGNVTGIAGAVPDWGKYLELAHEAVAGATRVAVIANPTSVVYADYVAQNEAAARQLGLKLQMIPVASTDEIGPAFDVMKRQRAEVLVFGPDRIFQSNLNEILERARASRLPVLTTMRPAANGGALLTYGLHGMAFIRQAAEYSDRLLRGAKPADLPFAQPTRYELVINRKTAKTLGLTIPRALLLRADEVIE
jgi:putative ABC transport system substrate-binding protein